MVEQDPANKRLKVTGLNMGKGLFKARAEDIEHTVYYRVQERAGYAPTYVKVEVSGNPAPIQLIKKALRADVYVKSNPKEGASVFLGSPLKKGKYKNLKPGQILNLLIPVKIMGEGFISSIKKAKIEIENVYYKRPEPQLLLVSKQTRTNKGRRRIDVCRYQARNPFKIFLSS